MSKRYLFDLEGRPVYAGDWLHVSPSVWLRAGAKVKAERPFEGPTAMCRSENGAIPQLRIDELSWTPFPETVAKEQIAAVLGREYFPIRPRDVDIWLAAEKFFTERAQQKELA